MSSWWSTSSLVVTLAVGVACGPVIDDPTDDAGNDDGSSTASTTDGPVSASEGSGVADSGTTTPGTTASDGDSETDEPVDCDVLSADECMRFAACQTVRGTEATLERETGEYYCSDLAFPFACTPADCEAVPNVVICKLDEPGVAMWVLDDCIPAGWEPCPDAMCG